MSSSPKFKRFSQPTAASQNVANIVNASTEREQANGSELIPISRIQIDPDNPRKLKLDPNNPLAPIAEDDPLREVKLAQLEKLKELAVSIEGPAGLINPIQVYRKGDGFVLVTGHRRFAAHKILGLSSIHAVIHRNPLVRLSQWIENTQREGVDLDERLMAILAVRNESELKDRKEFTEYMIKKAGIGRTRAYQWAQILYGPQAVIDAINSGVVTRLTEAALLTSLSGEELADALARLTSGDEEVDTGGDSDDSGSTHKPSAPPAGSERATEKRSRGRPSEAFTLGKTKSPQVVKLILTRVLGDEQIEGLGPIGDIDFDNKKEVNQALKKLWEHLEAKFTTP